ncbi:MAG: uracil-DNA glycosylase [Dehalococcoidales bacterium]|nr:uracil-DNA glycosylase [Dehalococcoidales bacterium]
MSALTDLYPQIQACRRCEIGYSRTKAVPGEGSEHAEIMFIGEAPGWHEDQQGRPFVGPAGQFLDQLIASIGLKREQVYIANVVKCRPPNNREPLPTEIQNCKSWLDEQIKLVHPKMIVTLGRFSMEKYFPGKTISKIHGTAKREGDIIYFAMYHPAAALHQGNLRKDIEADMLKIPRVLAEAAPAVQEPEKPAEQQKQLNLF